jgi:phosphopantetheinyl transferase (holo-ACP synthase)
LLSPPFGSRHLSFGVVVYHKFLAGAQTGMPVRAVGTDLVSVGRIARLIKPDRDGSTHRADRFLKKVLHPQELAQVCSGSPASSSRGASRHADREPRDRSSVERGWTDSRRAQFVASRWALKEASFKAVCSARWQHSQRTRDAAADDGRELPLRFPEMRLSRNFPKRLVADPESGIGRTLRTLGVTAHASVSHCDEFATATVVLDDFVEGIPSDE